MRCHHDIWQAGKVQAGGCAFGLCWRRVLVPGIDDGAADASFGQRIKQGLFLNHRAAPHIQDHGLGAHRRQLSLPDQAAGLFCQGQRHHQRIS